MVLIIMLTRSGLLAISAARAAKTLPSEATLWHDPDPSVQGERGETWRLTDARNRYINNTNYHRVSTPFSPNGRYLVFTSKREKEVLTGLYLVDFGNARRLICLNNRAPGRNNLWDLSGTRIYSFLKNAGQLRSWDIYETDISQLPRVRERQITGLNIPAAGWNGVWGLSADGEQLAFSYGFVPSSDGGHRYIEKIATVAVRNRAAAPADGVSDETGIRVRRRIVPKSRNVKVFLVGNRYVVWGHRDTSCPLIAGRPKRGHIHVLDLGLNPNGPNYDRVFSFGGHAMAHPDQFHYLCDDGGYDLDGNKGATAWGSYDVQTGLRRDLNTPWNGINSHPNVSPDGTLLAADMLWPKLLNWVCVLPLDGRSKPILLVEHGMYPIPIGNPKRRKRVPADLGEPYHHVSVHWSPDATKIAWCGTAASDDPFKNHVDVFVTVFQSPAPVARLIARRDGRDVVLSWCPGLRHREIKEYRIFRRDASGGFVLHDTVAQCSTWLAGASHLTGDATVIEVASTAGFPESGMLELQPTRTVDRSEVVRYGAKDATRFLDVQRGVAGTVPSEHDRRSFVWYWPAERGYVDPNAPSEADYRVQAVEWFGIKSPLSDVAERVGGNTLRRRTK